MKKYVALVIATLLLTGGAFTVGELVKNSVPFVSVSKVEPMTIKDTVICSGKIEYSQSRDIRTIAGGTIETLSVKKGDKVKAGEILATVNAVPASGTDATKNETGVATNTQEIYKAVMNGDYSVLDNYDQILENASEPVQKDSEYTAEPVKQTITAPINGTVADMKYQEGEYAVPGEMLFSVVSDDRLQVVLPVNEVKISEIKVGQNATITGSGFKDSVYNGTVTAIASEAKQTATTSGKETTVDVTVSIENPGNDIKPGYTAKCSIISSVKADVLLLPYQAVLAENNGKEFVYLYNNGKAAKKYVQTNGEYTDGLEVLKGIKSDDFVITTPDRLHDQAAVKIKKESAVDTLA